LSIPEFNDGSRSFIYHQALLQ